MKTIRVRATVTADRRAVLELPELPADVLPGEHEFEVGLPAMVVEFPPVMLEKVLADRPKAFPSRPTHPKLAAEHDAFEAMLPELMRQHAGRFVAVEGGKVVAVGDSEVGVLTAVYRANPTGHPLVRLVTDQPQPLPRLPSLRQLGERPA